MGIDALVFCDCLEKGSLRKSPSPEWLVYVQDDGCRESASPEPRHQAAFGHWHETACPHDYGILMHRRLDVADAAESLQSCPESARELPPMLQQVLSMSGTEPRTLDVPALQSLLAELQLLRPAAPSVARRLLDDLEMLATAALRIGKPLVF